MCGRCDGEPHRGVTALFRADEQAQMGFSDREDWRVVSADIIVYLGESSLKNEDHPLVRSCEAGRQTFTEHELLALNALSSEVSRPAVGR